MNILSVKAVADHLVKGTVTELQKFLSAIFIVLLGVCEPLIVLAVFSSPFLVPDAGTGLRSVTLGISILLWLVPTIFLFYNDLKNGGKHFLERYFCLAVPLFIQIIGIAFVALRLIRWIAPEKGSAINTGLQVMLTLGTLIFFYWRLNKWLKYTAQHQQS